jgi:hypothetical protein
MGAIMVNGTLTVCSPIASTTLWFNNYDCRCRSQTAPPCLYVYPYNDFMSEGGKLYEATKETAEAVGFYDTMPKLIPAIRAARIQVIIVPHHRWREGDHKGWKRYPRRHYQEDKQ